MIKSAAAFLTGTAAWLVLAALVVWNFAEIPHARASVVPIWHAELSNGFEVNCSGLCWNDAANTKWPGNDVIIKVFYWVNGVEYYSFQTDVTDANGYADTFFQLFATPDAGTNVTCTVSPDQTGWHYISGGAGAEAMANPLPLVVMTKLHVHN